MFSNHSKMLATSLAVALLASMTATVADAQQASSQAPSVTTATLHAQSLPLSYSYAARLSAFRQTEIRARVSGILLKRNFVEGASVKAGDVLFLIDPAPFQAALAQAQAELGQQQAQLDQATREEQRNVRLFNQNVGSEKSRDDAISARQLAQAAVAAAEAQVQTADLNLSYTRVAAPIDGVTSLEQMPEGSLVTSDSSLLANITQTDPIYVNFSFSDAEAREVRHLLDLMKAKGDVHPLSVKLTFGDGTVYPHEGRIDFTSAVVDASTGTIQARAVIDNPDRELIPGQFVRATVTGVTVDSAIAVPEIAVMQGPQGQFVYTVDNDGKAQMRPVTLGQQVGESWIVQTGLNDGDRVITEGVIKVRPGAPVAASAGIDNDSNKVATN
ncbi:efflux RND transporter periplasmic adaptor subunit [Neorhizobium alkalisoli]|uniref:Membrane fusion protein (Multidrug efflux system) n=1 Tax=Neorhizobium alkalisoli TaxID=528178 RepID=A0A561R812_9HYPH|nr:efflux RND transporter periplasmic adaptor subunit [Neorhizobium alkalisoli]TWF58722.1 membrane fusion protein (multidrug efflux system) [Neorhizobium alkalisoli]